MVLVRFSKEEKKWLEIQKENKQPGDFYLDGKLKKKRDLAKKFQLNNFDMGILIDGGEGIGKSECGGNIARYMSDDRFDPVKHIIQDYKDVVEKIKNTPDGYTIVLDEASLIFASVDVMKKEQKHMTKILQVCRQKNLCFIIIAPSFFNLSKYISVERTKILLHTYLGSGKERGFFQYFGEKRKRKLYQIGKRNYNSYNDPPSQFKGRFTQCELYNDDKYIQVKRETLMKTLEGDDREGKAGMARSPATVKKNFLLERMKVIKLSDEEWEKITGLKLTTIQRYKRELDNITP